MVSHNSRQSNRTLFERELCDIHELRACYKFDQNNPNDRPGQSKLAAFLFCFQPSFLRDLQLTERMETQRFQVSK